MNQPGGGKVKCATCGNTYNGKTGGPLTGAIALYLAVVIGGFFAVAAVAVFLLVTQF